jgi:hypothetical protein
VTDAHEQKLIADYNKAVNALKRIPRGDPRHIPLSAKLIAAQRALKRYRQIKQTRDQN